MVNVTCVKIQITKRRFNLFKSLGLGINTWALQHISESHEGNTHIHFLTDENPSTKIILVDKYMYNIKG